MPKHFHFIQLLNSLTTFCFTYIVVISLSASAQVTIPEHIQSAYIKARDYLATELNQSPEFIDDKFSVDWQYIQIYEDDQPLIIIFKQPGLTCQIELGSQSLKVSNFQCQNY